MTGFSSSAAAVALPTPRHIAAGALPAGPVRLISAYSTRNLGDAAILRALAQLVPGGRAEVASLDDAPMPIPGIGFADYPSEAIRISVGGDIFNNHRPYFVTRHFISKLREIGTAPSRTILAGQTIPASCRHLALHLLTGVLARVRYVMVRDEASAALLKSMRVKAHLSWDLAFVTEFDDTAQARAKQLFEKAGMDPARAAVISVRPFDAMYPVDQAAFDANIRRVCSGLIERGHQVALLIQSDVAAWDEDRSAARRIKGDEARIKIIDCLDNAADPDPAGTLTAVLNLANIAVGVRYHTTVLRLAGGRQPYNLFYSRKGEDLQRRLGLAGSHAGACLGTDEIRQIEATADKLFDPAPQRAHIQDHFTAALKAAGA